MHLGKKHSRYKSPAVRVVAHPGDEALAEVSLAEAEAEVRHLLLLTLQAEDLAHRVHVQVQEVLSQSELSILSSTNHSSQHSSFGPIRDEYCDQLTNDSSPGAAAAEDVADVLQQVLWLGPGVGGGHQQQQEHGGGGGHGEAGVRG